MFVFHNFYLFIITSLLLNVTPGNDMLYVGSRSVSQGTIGGIISAIGIFSGCFVHILAAVLGMSIIIAQSAYAFQIVKLAGAAYLIYLGIKAIISKSNNNRMPEEPAMADNWKLFQQGIITSILNPKVAIFFLSFLPQFIDGKSPYFKIQLFTLGLWFDIQGTLVLIIVACILGKTKEFFKQNPKIWRLQEKLTGFILIGLGIKVAIMKK